MDASEDVGSAESPAHLRLAEVAYSSTERTSTALGFTNPTETYFPQGNSYPLRSFLTPSPDYQAGNLD